MSSTAKRSSVVVDFSTLARLDSSIFSSTSAGTRLFEAERGSPNPRTTCQRRLEARSSARHDSTCPAASSKPRVYKRPAIQDMGAVCCSRKFSPTSESRLRKVVEKQLSPMVVCGRKVPGLNCQCFWSTFSDLNSSEQWLQPYPPWISGCSKVAQSDGGMIRACFRGSSRGVSSAARRTSLTKIRTSLLDAKAGECCICKFRRRYPSSFGRIARLHGLQMKTIYSGQIPTISILREWCLRTACALHELSRSRLRSSVWPGVP